MKYDPLPREHHVARDVSYRRTLRDPVDDRIIGVLGTAFERPESDPELSVTWIEYFPGEWEHQVLAAFRAICSSRRIGKKGALTWANVGRLIDACTSAGRPIRVIHDPEPANCGHALITMLPRNEYTLLDLLAIEVFAEFFLTSDLHAKIADSEPRA